MVIMRILILNREELIQKYGDEELSFDYFEQEVFEYTGILVMDSLPVYITAFVKPGALGAKETIRDLSKNAHYFYIGDERID